MDNYDSFATNVGGKKKLIKEKITLDKFVSLTFKVGQSPNASFQSVPLRQHFLAIVISSITLLRVCI